ncbi:hypothetical protein D3C72_1931220 [compost metagenome]
MLAPAEPPNSVPKPPQSVLLALPVEDDTCTPERLSTRVSMAEASRVLLLAATPPRALPPRPPRMPPRAAPKPPALSSLKVTSGVRP